MYGYFFFLKYNVGKISWLAYLSINEKIMVYLFCSYRIDAI